MKKILLPLLFCAPLAFAAENFVKDEASGLAIYPVKHATMVIRAGNQVVYVDPVGGPSAFAGFYTPTLILITDIHPDHLDRSTILAVKDDKTRIIASTAVTNTLGFGESLVNGGKTWAGGIGIEAVPMYNTTRDRLEHHPKGRGNGYVLTFRDKRVYISGDTEDIPEMRSLAGIDYAFVCMNLPYTMTVQQAASAVATFKPKVVIPYHHRGSDVDRFQQLVNARDKSIQVMRLDWYPDGEARSGQ